MNDLESHLNRLIAFTAQGGVPPSWSGVLFVEDASIARGMPSLIPRDSLIPLADYAARFTAHLDAGHSWINMNAAGILGDALIVIIELPGYKNDVPRGAVSVNVSGPAMLNGEPQWDASGVYEIVG